MMQFITEKEFVPEVITRCGTQKSEADKGLYQIVYGVLQHYLSYDDIYDLVVRICKEQKSEVVKRFKLTEWKSAVNGIIAKLEKLEKIGNEVMVYIPFTYYYDSLNGTLSRFEFVRFTIDEILAKGDSQMEISSSPQYDYPVKALDLLFEDYRIKTVERIMRGDAVDAVKEKLESYYSELIHDELMRRGVNVVTESFCKYDYDNDLHTECREETYVLSPSEHYKHPEKFFELNRFNDKHKLLKVNMVEPVKDDNSDNGSDDKANNKEKTGILYYMLKELTQETNEKRWKKKAASLISYILSSPKADTARRYIDLIANHSEMGARFYETLDKVLGECGFTVPQEIKDGLPQKKHIQLD